MSINPDKAKGQELRDWLTERRISFNKSDRLDVLRDAVRRGLRDEAFRRSSALANAFRMTEPVERDLRPDGFDMVVGWDFVLSTMTVLRAWSSTVYHGYGQFTPGGSASQGPRSLFSTERKALRALRVALEQETAAKLVEIDKRIRKANGDDGEVS
jgi:hypothetical protein